MRGDTLVSWSTFKPFDPIDHKATFFEAEAKSCYDVLSFTGVLLSIFLGGKTCSQKLLKTPSQYFFLSSWSKQVWQSLHLPEKRTIFSLRFWNPLKTSVTCCFVFIVIKAKLGLREKWSIQHNWRNSIAMLHRFSKCSTVSPGVNIAFITKLNKHFSKFVSQEQAFSEHHGTFYPPKIVWKL